MNAGQLYALCEDHYHGRGMAVDYAKAREYALMAAELGHAPAMYRLGVILEEGMGCEKDPAAADDWYRKAAPGIRDAADAGDPDAMHKLGELLEAGGGVAKDEEQAAVWRRKAADAGNTEAMRDLADILREGRGAARDEAGAAGWYRKAAESGDSRSMFLLGFMLREGRGMPKDEARAGPRMCSGSREGYRMAPQGGPAGARRRPTPVGAHGTGVVTGASRPKSSRPAGDNPLGAP